MITALVVLKYINTGSNMQQLSRAGYKNMVWNLSLFIFIQRMLVENLLCVGNNTVSVLMKLTIKWDRPWINMYKRSDGPALDPFLLEEAQGIMGLYKRVPWLWCWEDLPQKWHLNRFLKNTYEFSKLKVEVTFTTPSRGNSLRSKREGQFPGTEKISVWLECRPWTRDDVRETSRGQAIKNWARPWGWRSDCCERYLGVGIDRTRCLVRQTGG